MATESSEMIQIDTGDQRDEEAFADEDDMLNDPQNIVPSEQKVSEADREAAR